MKKGGAPLELPLSTAGANAEGAEWKRFGLLSCPILISTHVGQTSPQQSVVFPTTLTSTLATWFVNLHWIKITSSLASPAYYRLLALVD
jgi:hypothetical protein